MIIMLRREVRQSYIVMVGCTLMDFVEFLPCSYQGDCHLMLIQSEGTPRQYQQCRRKISRQVLLQQAW